jgi:hypothetical protein
MHFVLPTLPMLTQFDLGLDMIYEYISVIQPNSQFYADSDSEA